LNPIAQELESRLDALPGDDSPERVDLLVKFTRAISTRAISIDDPSRARSVSLQTLEMSKRLDYEKGVAFSLYHMGFGEYLRSDHEKAMALLLESEKMMNHGGNSPEPG